MGVLQVLVGIALSLIALFSSYDHITVFGRIFRLQQQWGIGFIAASLATVFTGCVQYIAPLGRDAQLASRSRLRAADAAFRAAQDSLRTAQDSLRAAQDTARAENEAAQERNLAGRERNRAAEARERQAEAAASQRESLEDIRRAVFLSARVQLDPTGNSRARLQAFLTLMAERPMGEEKGV